MSAYMSYSMTKELMNYYRYPVITNTKMEVLEELPFPAVTFCNQSPFNLSKIREADPHLETYFKKISFIGKLTESINWSEPGFDRPIYRESQTLDWWKNIHMSPEEMFYMCLMNGVTYWPCWSSMKPVFTTSGYCSTFNWNASDVTNVRVTGLENNLLMYAKDDQSNYALGSQLSAGMKVILHDPRTHPDVARTSFLAAPGSTTNAVVQRSTYQYLPLPYQAFKNRTCVDTFAPSFKNTLQYFDTYTYENCLRECFTKMTHDKCGCITPSDNVFVYKYAEFGIPLTNLLSIMAVISGTIGQYCSIRNFTTCHGPAYEYVMRNATIQKECACQLPCSFATYDVKVSASKYPSDVSVSMLLDLEIAPDEEYIRENYLEIRISYADLVVQSTEQIPRYTTETIIGNLGGQMGICLGASILTLTELGEFLLFLCLTIFRRRKHGGEAMDIKPTEH